MTQSLPNNASKVVFTSAKKLPTPATFLLYGEPGVGKSTWASKANGVIFIPTDPGSNEIEVRRALVSDADGTQRAPSTLEEFNQVLNGLVQAAESKRAEWLKWICIDTVDALERLIHEYVAKANGKTSITDIGYAKGYDYSIDALRGILVKFERLQRAGVGTILIAHSHIAKFQNPEGADFDYYDIKCHKKFAGTLIDWVGNVLFARREQSATTNKAGKTIGVSSQVRFLYTQRQAAFVAKNRYDMPERLPLSWYAVEKAMADHKPANPTLIREAIVEMIAKLPENQAEATDKLNSIHQEDARELVVLLDYIRSRVATETLDTVTTTEEATT